MKKIKIAHILHTYLSVTENWIYNQIIYNNECNPVIISQFRRNEKLFPAKNIYSASVFGCRWANYLSRLKVWPPESFYRSIIDCEKPDIIHGHFSTESWRVLSTALQRNIPIVTTFYGLDVNKLPRRNYWKKKYEKLFSSGAIFIVEGHHMADNLAKIGCNPEKIRVVHIGIDIERIREKLKIVQKTDNTFRVLFVGLGREKKGPLDAAYAFSALVNEYRDSELHLIGDGIYRKAMEQVFYKKRCSSKVIFHGFTEVDRYHELLAKCDVVLTPSCTASDGDTEGGAPVVCIEAQAAQKPVVGTFHCDIPEIVIHGKTGLLCDEHDIKSLTENLLLLARDPLLRSSMGEAGYSHIRKNHDIRNQVSVLNGIYKDIEGMHGNR